MGIPSFFHLPEHRRFNFKTRYYDKEKEERENRIKNIERELDSNDEKGHVSRIKGQMKRRFDRADQYAAGQKRKSNIRLVIIIGILLFISYLLLFY